MGRIFFDPHSGKKCYSFMISLYLTVKVELKVRIAVASVQVNKIDGCTISTSLC